VSGERHTLRVAACWIPTNGPGGHVHGQSLLNADYSAPVKVDNFERCPVSIAL